MPDPDPRDHRALLLSGLIELVIGLTLAFGRRLPQWAVKALVVYAGLLMTSAVVAIERPLATVPLYYIYPVCTAAYFGTRLDVVAVLVLIAVTFPTALSLNDSATVPGLSVATVMTICTVVAIFTRRITERVEVLLDDLERVALTDALTGLPNRRALQDELPDRIERARLAGSPLSVVIFDLDHFKLLNDRHGHDAGDEALRRFAALLRNECREGDLVARMGGEEFTAVLHGGSVDAARGVRRAHCPQAA